MGFVRSFFVVSNMHRYLCSSFVLLSLLTGCEAQSQRTLSADFEVKARAVTIDERISVWEFEIVAQQECKLILKEGESGSSTVWLKSSEGTTANGRIVIAASLVAGDESQKGNLTFLARVYMANCFAGGPSVYQIDAEALESVVSINLQDQEGAFGTPIHVGKVCGGDLTLIVDKQ